MNGSYRVDDYEEVTRSLREISLLAHQIATEERHISRKDVGGLITRMQERVNQPLDGAR